MSMTRCTTLLCLFFSKWYTKLWNIHFVIRLHVYCKLYIVAKLLFLYWLDFIDTSYNFWPKRLISLFMFILKFLHEKANEKNVAGFFKFRVRRQKWTINQTLLAECKNYLKRKIWGLFQIYANYELMKDPVKYTQNWSELYNIWTYGYLQPAFNAVNTRLRYSEFVNFKINSPWLLFTWSDPCIDYRLRALTCTSTVSAIRRRGNGFICDTRYSWSIRIVVGGVKLNSIELENRKKYDDLIFVFCFDSFFSIGLWLSIILSMNAEFK